MPKRELWKVFEFVGSKGDTKDWALGYAGYWNPSDIPPNEIDKNPVLTLEEIADFADTQASSSDNDAFIGTHRILAALLHRKLGRQQATEIMREIAEYGGLDGISGCGGKADAFADLGIPEHGRWRLDDTKGCNAI